MKKCFVCNNESFSENLLKCYIEERPNKSIDKFCHLLCSMFFPELIFQTSGGESFFTGVQKIKQDNYLEDCYKCKKNTNGNCMIRCCAKSCFRFFHANCITDYKFIQTSKQTDSCPKFSIICGTEPHESLISNNTQFAYPQIKEIKEQFYDQKIFPLIKKKEKIESQRPNIIKAKKSKDEFTYDDDDVIPSEGLKIISAPHPQPSEGKAPAKIRAPELKSMGSGKHVHVKQNGSKGSYPSNKQGSEDFRKLNSFESVPKKKKDDYGHLRPLTSSQIIGTSSEILPKKSLVKMQKPKLGDSDKKKSKKKRYDSDDALFILTKDQFAMENHFEPERYKPVPYPKELTETREDEMKRWWSSIDYQYFRKGNEQEQKLLRQEDLMLTSDLFTNQYADEMQEPVKNSSSKEYANFRFNRKEIINDALPLKNQSFLYVLYENKSDLYFDDEQNRLSNVLACYELNPEATLELNPEEGFGKANKFQVLSGKNMEELDRYIENSTSNSYNIYQKSSVTDNRQSALNKEFLTLKYTKELDIKSFYSCITQQKLVNEVSHVLKEKGLGTNELLYEIICLNEYLKEIQRRNEKKKRAVLEKLREDPTNISTLQKQGQKLQNQINWNFMKKLFQQGFKDKNKEQVDILKQCREKNEADSEEERNSEKKSKKSKTKSKPKSTASNGSSDFLETDCCICFNNYTNEINPVVYCSSCNISFHQWCYGIQDIPTEDYHCEVCTHFGAKSTGKYVKKKEKERIKSSSVDCMICCQSNRPLKQIGDNWFHVTCLVLFNYARFKNGVISLKKNITNKMINNEIQNHKNSDKECEICLKKEGMKLSCNEPECQGVYHLMCAYLNGLSFKLGFEEPRGTKVPLNVTSSCFHHSTKSRNIKNQIYFRRFAINFRQTADFMKKKEYFEHMKNCKSECPLLRKYLDPDLIISEEDLMYFKNASFVNCDNLDAQSSKRGLQDLISNNDEPSEVCANTRKKFKKNSIDNQTIYNNIFD